MYPQYRLGNIATDDPARLMDSPAQRAFGAAKETTLPDDCLRCDFTPAMNRMAALLGAGRSAAEVMLPH